MIQANEIKVGNKISLYGQVATVVPNDFDKWCKDGVFNDFQPIPLTHDILVKAGFVKNGDWFYKAFFVLGFLTDDSHFQTELKFTGVEGDWRVLDITSLHQLQNLYFALTQTELIINL